MRGHRNSILNTAPGLEILLHIEVAAALELLLGPAASDADSESLLAPALLAFAFAFPLALLVAALALLAPPALGHGAHRVHHAIRTHLGEVAP